ncbi:hypothetical protein T8A63_07335 [Sulfitobacter sp. OXR-159]|uniref:hypothetical protein n=1 Tax=Sulfitobacter sp. OXR-159 TaxID=3100174 RepID=UPI002AC8EEEA|nr:hypothetical protein [Sulfitobacter sp. OXR-159]WPZ30768.1 hypothetical protein T8A63_06825 [Sulfitobacter sp. OXR-159]WPZ30869.1 hypothetical protein T8A63_07335 [Sulfitobacter sp. OXR-159]
MAGWKDAEMVQNTMPPAEPTDEPKPRWMSAPIVERAEVSAAKPEASKPRWMEAPVVEKPPAARREAMIERAQAAKAGVLEPSPESLQRAEHANRIASPGIPKPDLAQIQSQIDASQDRDATAAALLNKAGESLTLGIVGDEAAGAFDAAIGRGDRDERTKFYRDQESKLEEDHPGLSLAADVAPAFIPGLAAAGAVKKLGNITGRTVAGGIAGAAAGGTIGYMEGEGDDRAKSAATSAMLGGLFGSAAPKVTDLAASLPGRVKNLFVRGAQRPTVDILKASKNAAYKAADDAGEVFDGETMEQLAIHVRKMFEENNYVEETDSALRATLELLGRRSGKDTTLTQLDRIRKNLWKRYSNAKDQPQILDAIASIDHVIDKKGNASDLMGVARAANAKYAKAQLLEDAFTKARDQTAASGSGGNIVNKYRQAVTSIINNERKSKFFSQGEIEMMRAFVRGNNAENAKRLLGKLSPSGNGLMMALHVVGGVASSGATVPLMVAGSAAKVAADKSVIRGANEIQDFVAGMPRIAPRNSTGAALAFGAAPAVEELGTETRSRLSRGQ